jgi:hypothetical protein
MLFPGGTDEVPLNVQSKIPYSMNRGLENGGGIPPMTVPYYLGADQAHADINGLATLLPNHLLDRYDYSAGATAFVYEFTLAAVDALTVE